MKRIIALLLAVLAMFLLCSCKAGYDKLSDSPENVSEIPTPYTDLKLSESIAENVYYEVTSQKPYTINFRAKEDGTELFTFVFGGVGDEFLGTLTGEKENTAVYFTLAELNEKSDNYAEYAEYQAGANDIIASLLENKNFLAGEDVKWEPTGTFDIKTPIVTLKYPLKWKDKVKVDVSDEAVKFSYKDVKLFDIYFKEAENGSLLGTYGKTPLYAVSYTPDEKKLDEEQLEEYSAMQYAINVILNNLKKDKKFTIG